MPRSIACRGGHRTASGSATFSDRDGTLQIWKIRIDGSDLTQVTHERNASNVAWSPDGTRMAVPSAAGRPSSAAGSGAFIIDARRPWSSQTPELLPLAPAPARRFMPNSWSADGRSLVGQQNGAGTPGIVVYSIHDRTYQRLAEFGQWPVWLPDSRRVLFVSRGREFHILDTATKSTKQIARGMSSGYACLLRQRSEGRTLVQTFPEPFFESLKALVQALNKVLNAVKPLLRNELRQEFSSDRAQWPSQTQSSSNSGCQQILLRKALNPLLRSLVDHRAGIVRHVVGARLTAAESPAAVLCARSGARSTCRDRDRG